jgi:DeoR family fructose operon transcriptional repressor
MIPEVRRNQIISMLSNDTITSTEDIQKKLHISVSTLRRDLIKLQDDNRIVMLHGGGVKLAQHSVELRMQEKLCIHKSEKELIARKAASFVENGDVIFLDPSSTTYLMIPYLTGRDITVVTNGIPHITELIAHDIPCIMIGGMIKSLTSSCYGPITESTLKTLNFNKCFLGASGFSIESGITNHDMNERAIKLIALHNSLNPYFLLDSSKYQLLTLVKVADIGDYPILTDKIPDELKEYSNFILCN